MVTTARFAGAPGIELAADCYGSPADPAVLLFHGGGQTRHAWGGAAQALADRGWQAVTFDLRGHGESDWSPDGRYHLDSFAADVSAVARQFDRPALVGASLGGVSSLHALGSTTDPIARALVLVDITPRMERAGVDRIAAFMRQGLDGFASLDEVADAVASYLPNRKRPSDVTGLLKNVRLRPDGRYTWHWDPRFMERIDDEAGEPTAGDFIQQSVLEDACRRVTVPTMLVHGGASDVVSADGVQEFKALMPSAVVVDVAGAGHMVAGDRNDRFASAVIEFLESHAR